MHDVPFSTVCIPGYGLDGNGGCTICPAGTYSRGSSTTAARVVCSNCPGGITTAGEGATSRVMCTGARGRGGDGVGRVLPEGLGRMWAGRGAAPVVV